ncbi:MAG: hypothetical protein R3Y61_01255 [Rikenellaceae bacterium]
MKKLLFLLILPLFIFSCEKEEISNASYDTFIGKWELCSFAVEINGEAFYAYPVITFEENKSGSIIGNLPIESSPAYGSLEYLVQDGYIYLNCSDDVYSQYYDGEWTITSNSDSKIVLKRDSDSGFPAVLTLIR